MKSTKICNFIDFLAVLQRFYHQQSQLRERETCRHASPQHQPNDFVKYSAVQTASADKMDSNNHFLRHIPKLTQKLNPFKNTSNSNNHQHSNSSSSAYGSVTANDTPNYHTETIYTNSNIPIMKKNQRSSTLPPASSPIYANNACEYPSDMTEQGVLRPMVYGRTVNYKNGYETGPGSIDSRDDHGERNFVMSKSVDALSFKRFIRFTTNIQINHFSDILFCCISTQKFCYQLFETHWRFCFLFSLFYFHTKLCPHSASVYVLRLLQPEPQIFSQKYKHTHPHTISSTQPPQQQSNKKKNVPFNKTKKNETPNTTVYIYLSRSNRRLQLSGWFNSLAGVVKRRFASYVKSHLASGDNKKDRAHDRNQMHVNHYLHQNHQQHQQRASSPYRFDKLRTGQTVAPSSSSMPSSPYCTRATIDSPAQNGTDRLQSLSPRVLNTIDRRHRSPDPPPR